MKGTPGSVPPTMLPRGDDTCAKYQSDGACNPRWGSFASSGLPVSLRAPDTTQLSEPIARSSESYVARSALAWGAMSAYNALKSGIVHGGSPGYGGRNSLAFCRPR